MFYYLEPEATVGSCSEQRDPSKQLNGVELVKMQWAEENLKRLEEDGEEFRRELL